MALQNIWSCWKKRDTVQALSSLHLTLQFYREPPSLKERLSEPSQEKWYQSITPHREFYISSYQAQVSFEFLFTSNAVVRWTLQLLNYRDLQLQNLRNPYAVNLHPSGQVNDRKEKDMIISSQCFGEVCIKCITLFLKLFLRRWRLIRWLSNFSISYSFHCNLTTVSFVALIHSSFVITRCKKNEHWLLIFKI